MLRNVKVYFIAMIILLFGGSVYNSRAEQESVVWHNFYDDWWYDIWIGNPYGLYSKYGLVATDDGKYLAVMWDNTIGNYVSVDSGGIGYFYYFLGSDVGAPVFEISGGNIRAYYYDWCSTGDWINLNGSGFSTVFCYGDSDFWAYGIDVSNGKIRFCVNNWWWWDGYGWNCGDWITLHPCPDGYTYNSSTGKCEATPTYSCPSGYSYNPSTRKCEVSAQITYTCPLGSYPCVDTGSGVYCSPYQCVDIENPSNIQTSDTTQGANDKQNDGQVDSSTGKCQGVIRIFNGQDMRCRPPGIQTAWTLNCCSKDKNFIFRCSGTEQQLAKLRTTIKYKGQERDYTAADANCHYVGSYCAQKIPFIGCVQKKRTYCCFSSPLARIIQEQGRPQIGKGWGDPKNPDCSGFTIDEFQKLDFSKIDFSEWVNMVVGQETTDLRNSLPGQTQQMQQNIQKMYQ